MNDGPLGLGFNEQANEDDGEVILQEILQRNIEELEDRAFGAVTARPQPPKDSPSSPEKDNETHTQWALGGNGRYSPVGATIPTLPAGIYEPFATPTMWGLEQLKVSSDGIYLLPDMATEEILTEARKFWGSEERYRNHKLLYKRGIITWGPPGSGKTITIKLLMNELVKQGGIVVFVQNVPLAILCLKAIRRIEPKRNLIIVLEDIDEIINYNGESSVLSLLDGENSIDNILMVASTNYPDRLGARIINRPSRFDRRIYVGMPSDEARREYLRQATNTGLENELLEKWVSDTKEMSIAHLRELVAAVYCLDQEYADVVDRLKKMAVPVKGVEDGFKKSKFGFSAGNSIGN